MKTYDSFGAWLKGRPSRQRRCVATLRKLVRDAAPALTETSKWGNGVWVKGDLPLLFLHGAPDHLQFGFFAGAALSDPKKLLRGNGKFVRHIRIAQPVDIDEAAFTGLIRAAVKAPPYK